MKRIFTHRRIQFSFYLLASLCFLFIERANSQSAHFRNPLDIPIKLAANFGEIRTDHYHTGYDIRTEGKTGYAVHAAADGYISRINVSPYGFGNALYIMHPNGFMTVYGHLDRFNDAIANYVKAQQYAKQSFAVELYPDASKFPVKEGDLIAYSGNSGSSEGPHLHFEIRDASGESYPLNPKQFLPLPDTIPPRFTSLYTYVVDSEFDAQSYSKFVIKKNDTTFSGGHKVVSLKGKKSGLAVEVNDFVNGSTGENGVYMLNVFLDKVEIFSMKFDRLDFNNGRYVNAHIDYKARKQNGEIIQKLFVLPGDNNTIYPDVKDNGLIYLHDTLPHSVQIVATDDNGNFSLLNFFVRADYSDLAKETVTETGKHFSYDRANTFLSDSFKLLLPANVLYTDLNFQYSEDQIGASKYYSAINHVYNAFTPLQSFGDLYILPRSIPPELKSKAVIIYGNENGRISAKTTRWDGNFLTTRIRDFGDYFVLLDTTAPRIALMNAKQNQTISANEIPFKVSDNLSGVTKYNAYLDGKWLLMEYDAKNDRMICKLDSTTSKGNHSLKIVVSDEVNNESIYVLNFKR